MSTKIYNAYRFDGNIEELMSILKEIKKEYIELTKNILIGLNYNAIKFTKKRYPFLESDITIKELKDSSFGEFILQDIIEKEKQRGEYNPFNIDASVVVYFCESKIYFQFFGLPRDYQSLIVKKYKTKFKDYHYQNSTDQSNYNWKKEDWNKMSKERQKELEDEWEERYRIWEKILPDWSSPIDHGLLFDFMPSGYKFSEFCKTILKSIDV